MEKIWAGRSAGALDKYADELNSSIGVDKRMYKQDIAGSIAHAGMLAKCGIISVEEGAQLIEGLGGILDDLNSGALQIDSAAEDIHRRGRADCPPGRRGQEAAHRAQPQRPGGVGYAALPARRVQ